MQCGRGEKKRTSAVLDVTGSGPRQVGDVRAAHGADRVRRQGADAERGGRRERSMDVWEGEGGEGLGVPEAVAGVQDIGCEGLRTLAHTCGWPARCTLVGKREHNVAVPAGCEMT